MSGRLTQQVAWISGGASGIGAATVRLFVERGAAVMIADIRTDAARQLVEEVRAAGGRAQFTECDVSSEGDIRRSMERTVEQFGGLQVLVNCAGVVQVGLLHECTEDQWDRLMGVNVKGIFFSVKHGLAHLRRNAHSYVVNIGSISSFVGQAATPAYTTSKGAVLSLTQSIALDYAGLGLRCNCVCPGITDTPILREHLNKTADPEETLRQRLRRVPIRRVLQPDEIARAILYLSCEDSSGVTGTSIVVDGGYLSAAEWDATVEPERNRDD